MYVPPSVRPNVGRRDVPPERVMKSDPPRVAGDLAASTREYLAAGPAAPAREMGRPFGKRRNIPSLLHDIPTPRPRALPR